jgi:hypothetical protein
MKIQQTDVFQLIDKNYHNNVSNTTDIWELSNEKKIHEEQQGNYAFIVVKNNKKHMIVHANFDGNVYLDDFINE